MQRQKNFVAKGGVRQRTKRDEDVLFEWDLPGLLVYLPASPQEAKLDPRKVRVRREARKLGNGLLKALEKSEMILRFDQASSHARG